MKFPVYVSLLATLAIFASPTQAWFPPDDIRKIDDARSEWHGLLLASEHQSQQGESGQGGEATEEEPDCD